MKKNLVQHTEWMPKVSKHHTLIGGEFIDIPYQRWCNNERMRILKDPGRRAEVHSNVIGTKCALFVDDKGTRIDGEGRFKPGKDCT